ncbi:MAG: hypothetical protein JST42_21595 [Bacteroidetes bacterium]|nr:hypothetical protein [Bacteroidota bacterium]
MKNSIRDRMFEGISLWQQSGLTQKAWCEQNHIAYGSFHYWYKRYRNEEMAASSDKRPDGGFVRLMVDSGLAPAWGELVLSDGKKLIFHQPLSVDFIRALIG